MKLFSALSFFLSGSIILSHLHDADGLKGVRRIKETKSSSKHAKHIFHKNNDRMTNSLTNSKSKSKESPQESSETCAQSFVDSLTYSFEDDKFIAPDGTSVNPDQLLVNPAPLTIGGTIVLRGPLTNEHGDEVGKTKGSCTIFDVNLNADQVLVKAYCTGAFTLHEGSLMFSGPVNVENPSKETECTRLAIVGGTDCYKYATGSSKFCFPFGTTAEIPDIHFKIFH